MKAITVIQPWATLLASGKKRCETRSWKTSYRGEILIHAGKKDPLLGILAMGEEAWAKALQAIRQYEAFDRFERFPTGAIIGKARLVNCVQIDDKTAGLIREQNPDEYAFGDFTPGRYAWMMEDAVLFETPLPISGKQGLWKVPGNWDAPDMAH